MFTIVIADRMRKIAMPALAWLILVLVQGTVGWHGPTAQAADRPQSRTWTNRLGMTIEAEFVGVEDGKVRLKKNSGNIYSVTIETLSDADQKYIQQQIVEKSKPVEKPIPKAAAAERPTAKAPAAPTVKREPRWATFTNFRSGQSYRGKVIDREEDGRRLYVEAEDGRKAWLWAAQWRIHYEKDSDNETEHPNSASSAPVSSTASQPSAGEGRNVVELHLGSQAPTAPAVQQPAKEVVVTGVGTDPEKALQNAFSQAIEQTVGVLVDAETKVKNDELIRDEVLTYSKGYVEKYDVVKRREEGGLHYATIRAVVSRDKLVAKLKSIKVAVIDVAGELTSRQFQFDAKNEEQAAEMLRKILEGFDMTKLTKVEIVGEPVIEREGVNAKMTVTVRVSPDADQWKAFENGPRSLLEHVKMRRVRVANSKIYFAKDQLSGKAALIGVPVNIAPSMDAIFWDIYEVPQALGDVVQAAPAACCTYYVTASLLDKSGVAVSRASAPIHVRPLHGQSFCLELLGISPFWVTEPGWANGIRPVSDGTITIKLSQEDLARVAKVAVSLETKEAN